MDNAVKWAIALAIIAIGWQPVLTAIVGDAPIGFVTDTAHGAGKWVRP